LPGLQISGRGVGPAAVGDEHGPDCLAHPAGEIKVGRVWRAIGAPQPGIVQPVAGGDGMQQQVGAVVGVPGVDEPWTTSSGIGAGLASWPGTRGGMVMTGILAGVVTI